MRYLDSTFKWGGVNFGEPSELYRHFFLGRKMPLAVVSARRQKYSSGGSAAWLLTQIFFSLSCHALIEVCQLTGEDNYRPL